MFFTKHFSKMFFITGIGTASALLYAFFPEWSSTNIGKIPYFNENTIITQHWGMMVGLMGIFMIVASKYKTWRPSIVLYSALEKSFMVFLVLYNSGFEYSKGFYLAAGMDSIVVLWTLLYWKENKKVLCSN